MQGLVVKLVVGRSWNAETRGGDRPHLNFFFFLFWDIGQGLFELASPNLTMNERE